jgi:hypothetical protein
MGVPAVTEPRTAAGRRLSDAAGDLVLPQARRLIQDYILAIEAEPAALDVERLARAICASRPPEPTDDYLFVDDECRGLARRTAAEYERLAGKPR